MAVGRFLCLGLCCLLIVWVFILVVFVFVIVVTAAKLIFGFEPLVDLIVIGPVIVTYEVCIGCNSVAFLDKNLEGV